MRNLRLVGPCRLSFGCVFLFCVPLLVGCPAIRLGVGTSVSGPQESYRALPVGVSAEQKERFRPGFALDVGLGIHFPLVDQDFTLGSLRRIRQSGSVLWWMPELGYSLDAPYFPGKFVVSSGFAYHFYEGKQVWGVGWIPSFVLGGSELGVHVGMRNALIVYFRGFSFQAQHEFLSREKVTHTWRFVFGVELFGLMASFSRTR